MLRDTPHSPLATPLRLFSRGGPQPTARTVQLLRRYDLDKKLEKDSDRLTADLQRLIDQEPAAEKVYALVSRNRYILSRFFGCKDACSIMPQREREGEIVTEPVEK